MGTTSKLPLIPVSEFGDITALLAGKTIRYQHGKGNAGDTLIHAGARCLFRKFNTRVDNVSAQPDLSVWAGGGNLGVLYKETQTKRQAELKLAMEWGIPFVVLPQSVTDADETLPKSVRVFVREKSSQQVYPESILAPDTALAFDEDVSVYTERKPLFGLGIFLRRDVEAANQSYERYSLGDVAYISWTYDDYFRVASLFETIVTDRLHFAIVALILRKPTVLLPNSYFKNQAVYDAWLKRLGCLWGIDEMMKCLRRCDYNPESIRERLAALDPAR